MKARPINAAAPRILLTVGAWACALLVGVAAETNLPSGNRTPSGKYQPQPPDAATNLPSREQAETTLKQALGVRQTGPETFAIGDVLFNRKNRSITLPARVNLREIVCEYALVSDFGKKHESVFATAVRPDQVHMASLLLSVAATNLTGPLNQSNPVSAANAVTIEVSWKTNGADTVRYTLADLLVIRRDAPPNATMAPRPTRFPAGPWLYNGSQIGASGFQAQAEGSFIALIRDDAALVNNPNDDRDNDRIHYPDATRLPPEGTPVEITLTFAARP